jgi:hypothetical protein
MGSCEGFFVAKLLVTRKPCPFSHVAGPRQPVTTSDCRDGYLIFYDRLLNGSTVKEAGKSVKIQIDAFDMRADDALDLWEITAEDYRRTHLTEEGVVRMQEAALARLEDEVASNPRARDLILAKYRREALEQRLAEWRETGAIHFFRLTRRSLL